MTTLRAEHFKKNGMPHCEEAERNRSVCNDRVRRTLTEKRRQFVYEWASEAVMRARIEIAKKYPGKIGTEIDYILARAMNNAGKFALQAFEQKEPTGRPPRYA